MPRIHVPTLRYLLPIPSVASGKRRGNLFPVTAVIQPIAEAPRRLFPKLMPDDADVLRGPARLRR